MSRESFRAALFAVIEHLTKMELRVSSKNLILTYFNGSDQPTSLARARETVERYAQQELPSPAELASREQQGSLSKLDRLVIAMDEEAVVWDES